MSLIHWWPLRDSLADIAGDTPLSPGTTGGSYSFTNTGKLGKCVSLVSQNLNVANPFIGLEDWSISFWCRDDGVADWGDIICWYANFSRIEVYSSGGNWHWYNGQPSGWYDLTTGNVFSPVAIQSGTTRSVWRHIAITKSGTNAKLYLDGVLKLNQENAVTFTSGSDKMYFNSRAVMGGHSGSLSLSDVKAYDHALSQAEVRELSRALTVHYSFNDGFSTNLCNWRTTSTIYISGWDGYPSYINGILNLDALNGWRCFMWDVGAANVGKPVTFSYEYRVTDTSNAGYIYVQNMSSVGYGSSLKEIPLSQTTWKRDSVTVNSAARYIGFNVRGVDETGKHLIMQVRNVKIANNTWDNCYSEYNVTYSPANEAGYGPNGVLYGSYVVDETLTGHRALRCVGSGTGTPSYVDLGDIDLNTNNLTFCVWCKWNSLQVWSRIFDFGRGTEGQDTDILIANSSNSSTLYFAGRAKPGDTVSSLDRAVGTITVGDWYFISAVIDNTDLAVYIYKEDGTVQKHTGTIPDLGDNVTFVNCYLGKSNWSADSYFDGQIADFRVYATSLGETEVKELFTTKGYISDKGDIMCGQFVEDKSQAQVTSQYNFETQEVCEGIGDGYERLEYIENTYGNSYSNPAPSFDTGIVPALPFKAIVRFTTNNNITGDDGVILGASDNNGNFIPFYIYMGEWHSDDLNKRIGAAPANTYFEATYEATSSNRTTTINGVSHTFTGTKTLPSISLWAMNGNWPNHQTNRGANVKLHSLDIINAGKPVRSFVPVRQISTGKIGLYDVLHDTFYPEQTGATVTAGAVVATSSAAIYEDQHISGRNIIEI